MSETGQQRYCTNCGTEIRLGTRFCVSCGASLVRGSAGPDQFQANATQENLHKILADALRAAFRRFSWSHLTAARNGIRDVPSRIINWFRDLPSVTKLIIGGIMLLLLFTLLSPIALVASAVVLGISVIALVVRMAQRGPVQGWGIVAVASLVLTIGFGGVSNAFYGTGFLAGGDLGSREDTDQVIVDYPTTTEDSPTASTSGCLTQEECGDLLGGGFWWIDQLEPLFPLPENREDAAEQRCLMFKATSQMTYDDIDAFAMDLTRVQMVTGNSVSTILKDAGYTCP